MRADIRTVVLAGGAVAVLLLAVLGAAAGGSWELEERNFGGTVDRPPPTLPPAPTPAPLDAAPTTGDSSLDWSWVGAVGVTLAVVLAGLALWWSWRRLRRHGVPRRPPVHDSQAVPTAAVEPELPVLRRGVTAAQQFLAEIPGPSDAVIAAWVALEDAATASGVRRAPSQTPTEFTVAVLDRTDADPAATAELLALYHRARFSGQPIGAGDVARAARCLGRLAARWDALDTAGGSAR